MNEFYTMKNQNPSTAEIFRWFNKMPNQKEGDSEMGMDNYEQKNLQTILCRLNEAELKNQKLEHCLELMQHTLEEKESEEETNRSRITADRGIMCALERLTDKNLAEIQVTFRLKSYFDD